jgi:hypothetical protein
VVSGEIDCGCIQISTGRVCLFCCVIIHGRKEVDGLFIFIYNLQAEYLGVVTECSVSFIVRILTFATFVLKTKDKVVFANTELFKIKV